MTYDRTRVSFERLLRHATATGCDRTVWTTTDAQRELARASLGDRAVPASSLTGDQRPRPDREQQYYLLQTPLRFVPLTRAQATRLNAAVGAAGLGADEKATANDWRTWLSPAQQKQLALVRAHPDHAWPQALGQPIAAATLAFESAANRLR